MVLTESHSVEVMGLCSNPLWAADLGYCSIRAPDVSAIERGNASCQAGAGNDGTMFEPRRRRSPARRRNGHSGLPRIL
jgi:hypothetical protein